MKGKQWIVFWVLDADVQGALITRGVISALYVLVLDQKFTVGHWYRELWPAHSDIDQGVTCCSLHLVGLIVHVGKIFSTAYSWWVWPHRIIFAIPDKMAAPDCNFGEFFPYLCKSFPSYAKDTEGMCRCFRYIYKFDTYINSIHI